MGIELFLWGISMVIGSVWYFYVYDVISMGLSFHKWDCNWLTWLKEYFKEESSVSSSGGLMGETIMDFMQTYENIMIDVYNLPN